MGKYFLQTYLQLKSNDLNSRGAPKYNDVKRWAKKVDIVKGDLFKLEYLHFPYNIDNLHWALITVSFVHKKVVYYDSMHSSDDVIATHVFQYILEHYWDVHNEELDITDWKIIPFPTGNEFANHYSFCPKQKNGEYLIFH
jgi:Ulp1 family protease